MRHVQTRLPPTRGHQGAGAMGRRGVSGTGAPPPDKPGTQSVMRVRAEGSVLGQSFIFRGASCAVDVLRTWAS